MESLVGRVIKVSDKMMDIVCHENANFYLKNTMVVNQYDDMEDVLVGFFESKEDMDYYYPQLMFYGFKPQSDMGLYDFVTFFISIDEFNYKEVTRLAKLKNLLQCSQ